MCGQCVDVIEYIFAAAKVLRDVFFVFCPYYKCYVVFLYLFFFFFSSRRRHTRSTRDWSSDVCSSDLPQPGERLDDPLVRHFVGTKLTLDHVDAGNIVDAHRSPDGKRARRPEDRARRLYRRRPSTTITHRVSAQSPVRVVEPANRLARRQAHQQLGRRQTEPRMPPIRGDVAERRQHEAALLQARMRQDEHRGGTLAAVIIEQVEIERTRGIALAALSPKARFQREQPGEQFTWRQFAHDL